MGNPVIVTVDDQEFICGLVATILKDTYDVHTFTSGEKAIAFLSTHSVDLILLDYEMPEMTGYEVLMAIHADKRTANIPVVFLTGVTNARLEAEMLQRGASAYIRKPIVPSDLLRCINEVLRS